jgi:hypothetical protein
MSSPTKPSAPSKQGEEWSFKDYDYLIKQLGLNDLEIRAQLEKSDGGYDYFVNDLGFTDIEWLTLEGNVFGVECEPTPEIRALLERRIPEDFTWNG